MPPLTYNGSGVAMKGHVVIYVTLLLQADKANSKMRSLKRQLEEMVRDYHASYLYSVTVSVMLG